MSVKQQQQNNRMDKRNESAKDEDDEEESLRRRLSRCRICARKVKEESATCIFGSEGKRRNLQENIYKYLYIKIFLEDRLPKMVCASCTSKLDSIHAFATMAMKSQERLKRELCKTSADSAVTVDSSDSSDSCGNKLKERGLLHSILTKGNTEVPNDEEPVQRRQRTPSTEEMEVKIDPMLFLQCALEQSSPVFYSDYSDESEDSPISEPLSLTNKKLDNSFKESISEVDLQKNRDDNDNENIFNIDDSKDNEKDEEDEFKDSDHYSKVKSESHICKICTRAFVSQIALQNHLWSHLPSMTSCDIQDTDGKDSTSSDRRYSHDANGVALQSDNCSDNNLNMSFICPICGKKISTKGNLKVHLETHRPKGKYGCDICGRIFKTQSNLFRHKEYHSGIQFPCSVCGRVYPTNSTLRAHSITHSDLRPHACPLCDKTFKRNQDLKFHINQHTGARPYQCPYCPKAFASSGNCFSHRKRMHPKEVHRDRQRAADLMR